MKGCSPDKKLNDIIRSYSPLNYSEKLISIASLLSPNTDFTNYSKIDLLKHLNEQLLTGHKGEVLFKYQLFKKYFKKNIVAAFEVNVNNSRLDFLTINGYSTAFEIKSGIDTLEKLKKQASDYSAVFDFNYVAIHEKHLVQVKKLVPKTFGIFTFRGDKREIFRKAKPNKTINAEAQLNLLNKAELRNAFPEYSGNIQRIFSSVHASVVNKVFKETLKKRYEGRWKFLVSNADEIFPLDLQFFFSSNIHPKYVYEY